MTTFDETPVQPAKDYVREVTARYIGPRRKSLTISGQGVAACFMCALLRDEAREHFLALYLNSAHQVVSFSLARLGTPPRHPSSRVKSFEARLVGACASSSGITTRQATLSRAPRIRRSPGD